MGYSFDDGKPENSIITPQQGQPVTPAPQGFTFDDGQPAAAPAPAPQGGFTFDDGKPANAPKEEQGTSILGALKDIGRAVTDLPTQIAGSTAAVLEGSDPYAERDWKDKLIESADAQLKKRLAEPGGEQKIFWGITRRDLRELPQNLSFSLVSALPGLGAGMATTAGLGATGVGAPGAIPAGYVAGGATSGVMAYRMDRNQFLRNAHEVLNEEYKQQHGTDMPDAVWQQKMAGGLDSLASEHGLYEAIPEAVGNALDLKIIRTPAGKLAGGVVRRLMGAGNKELADKMITTLGEKAAASLLVKMTGMYGTELATETVTQTGQHNTEIEAGVQKGEKRSFASVKDYWDSLKEVAPSVFLLTTVMGAGGHVINRAYEKHVENPRRATLIKDAVTEGKLSLVPDSQIPTIIENAETLFKAMPQDADLGRALGALKVEQSRRQLIDMYEIGKGGESEELRQVRQAWDTANAAEQGQPTPQPTQEAPKATQPYQPSPEEIAQKERDYYRARAQSELDSSAYLQDDGTIDEKAYRGDIEARADELQQGDETLTADRLALREFNLASTLTEAAQPTAIERALAQAEDVPHGTLTRTVQDQAKREALTPAPVVEKAYRPLTEGMMQRRTEYLQKQGIPFEVIQHPTRPDRFAVVVGKFQEGQADDRQNQQGLSGEERGRQQEPIQTGLEHGAGAAPTPAGGILQTPPPGRAQEAVEAQPFTATHELPDGTQVRAYAEDGTAQPGVWEDAEGGIIEDNNATPIILSKMDEEAHQAATSPTNDLKATKEQLLAGNAKMGHTRFQGLGLTIENPKGSTREDLVNGEWSQKMAHHYGYIKRTIGNDGDNVDVFAGPNEESRDVYVIDQKKQDGTFDEHKVMLGFTSLDEARNGYLANYEPGWDGIKSIAHMPIEEFKAWLKESDKAQPAFEWLAKKHQEAKAAPAPAPVAAPAAPHTTLPSGKYKGQSVYEIAKTDPAHLTWLLSRPQFRKEHKTLTQEIRKAQLQAAKEAKAPVTTGAKEAVTTGAAPATTGAKEAVTTGARKDEAPEFANKVIKALYESDRHQDTKDGMTAKQIASAIKGGNHAEKLAKVEEALAWYLDHAERSPYSGGPSPAIFKLENGKYVLTKENGEEERAWRRANIPFKPNLMALGYGEDGADAKAMTLKGYSVFMLEDGAVYGWMPNTVTVPLDVYDSLAPKWDAFAPAQRKAMAESWGWGSRAQEVMGEWATLGDLRDVVAGNYKDWINKKPLPQKAEATPKAEEKAPKIKTIVVDLRRGMTYEEKGEEKVPVDLEKVLAKPSEKAAKKKAKAPETAFIQKMKKGGYSSAESDQADMAKEWRRFYDMGHAGKPLSEKGYEAIGLPADYREAWTKGREAMQADEAAKSSAAADAALAAYADKGIKPINGNGIPVLGGHTLKQGENFTRGNFLYQVKSITKDTVSYEQVGFHDKVALGLWFPVEGKEIHVTDHQTFKDRFGHELEAQPVSPADEFAKTWDAMDYSQRQAIANKARSMRPVVHRLSGSKWAEISEGERADLLKAYQESAAPKAAEPGRTMLGKNRNGVVIFEDENGVRFQVDHGIKITETVGVIPGGGIQVQTNQERMERHHGEYLTAEEYNALAQQDDTPRFERKADGTVIYHGPANETASHVAATYGFLIEPGQTLTPRQLAEKMRGAYDNPGVMMLARGIEKLERQGSDELTPQEIAGIKRGEWPEDVQKAIEDIHSRKSTWPDDSPERIAKRNEIIAQLYAHGARNKDHRIDIVVGPPAAGKSTIAEPLAEKHGAIIIDSDEAKKLLPEFDNGMGAGATHEESAWIADEVLAKAAEHGDNIVLPVVGRSLEGLRHKIDIFKDMGYNVYVSYIGVSPLEAVKRSIVRFRRTGRMVNPQYILEQVGNKPAENYDAVRAEGVADGFEFYSNEVPEGQQPVLVGERSGRLGGSPGAAAEQQAAPGSQENEAAQGQVTEASDELRTVVPGRDGGVGTGSIAEPQGVGALEAGANQAGAPDEGSGRADVAPGNADAEQVAVSGEGAGAGTPAIPDERDTAGADSGRGPKLRPRKEGTGVGGGRGGQHDTRHTGVDRDNAGAEQDRFGVVAAHHPDRSPNYTITEADHLGEGGPVAKARANVEAIEIVQKLVQENRLYNATPAEQAKLAKWTGWGDTTIANSIFPETKPGGWQGYSWRPGTEEWKSDTWKELGTKLRDLLTWQEYQAARKATLNAHYTSEAVIRAMWSAAERLGFKSGRVLEPGVGSGNFLGLTPAALRDQIRYTGVELDPYTAKIAAALYPQSDIREADFIKFKVADGFFDMTIGNPPFLDVAVKADPAYAKHNFLLHDYFIAKSVDKTKPGGLIMLVTSKGTMDKLNDKARSYIAERADLLGAIRLPQHAFKGNAGTEVITDILFLRKRMPGEAKGGQAWTNSVEFKTVDGPININEYFAAHPDMMLGVPHLAGAIDPETGKKVKGLRSGSAEFVLTAPTDMDIEAAITKAVQALPEGAMTQRLPSEATALSAEDSPDTVMEGAYHLDSKGNLVQKVNGVGVRVEGMSAREQEVTKSYVPLRDAFRKLIAQQLEHANGEAEIKAAQEELGRLYDAFVKKHGPLNLTKKQETSKLDEDGQPIIRVSYPNLEAFKDDPDSYRVAAIENYNEETGKATKAAIFTQRVIDPPVDLDVSSASDTIPWSLNTYGRLDIEKMAERLGTTAPALAAELGDLVYLNPENQQYETADDYLSGDVRAKLAEARQSAELDPAFERNVAALEKVIPADKGPGQIDIRLGAPFVPAPVVRDFMEHMGLIRRWGDKTEIDYNQVQNSWSITGSDKTSVAAISEWGTQQVPATDVLLSLLNGSQLKVTMTVRDADGKVREEVDKEATATAQAKAQKMAQEFKNWVWADEKRTNVLVRIYNDRFNNTVRRDIKGDHLAIPGLSRAAPTPYPHQKDVVWRIILQGNTYMAHGVGSGKTLSSIIAGMEGRRLGAFKKPAYLVLDSTIRQFANEFLQAFPNARVLVANDTDLTPARRERFLARIAAENWDAVIIPHNAWTSFRFTPETTAIAVQEEIDAYEEVLAGETDKRKIKRLEKKLEALRQKIEAKVATLDKEGRKGLTFEETGIDFLFVDEAHRFRKLDISTRKANTRGITTDGSSRAMHLYLASRYLESKKPGRSMTFMSGTPLTNTMGELYSIQRFLQHDALKEKGLLHFDAWAGQFGDIRTDAESQPDGSLKMVSRFAQFINSDALAQMWGSIGDFKPTSALPWVVEKLPKIKGGQVQIIEGKQTEAQEAYREQLGARLRAVEGRKGPPKKGEDNILAIMGDGRLAALDQRFIDPTLPADPDSKLEKMIANVFDIWQESKDVKGVQLIFSDLGAPSIMATRGFSLYLRTREALIERGVPAKEIAFIQDYKDQESRLKLFDKVRAGEIRVLLGATEQLGTGVNVQTRIVALHHPDAPYVPAYFEQRNGRAIRQGNINKEVGIYFYVTKGNPSDENSYGILSTKQRFLDQFLSGAGVGVEADDIGDSRSLYEQARALASSDPRLVTLTKLENRIRVLELEEAGYIQGRSTLRSKAAHAEDSIERLTDAITRIDAAIKNRVETKGDAFAAVVGDTPYTDRKEAGEAILTALKAFYEETKEANIGETHTTPIGKMAGFNIVARSEGAGIDHRAISWRLVNGTGKTRLEFGDFGSVDMVEPEYSPSLVVRHLEQAAANLEAMAEERRRNIEEHDRTILQVRDALSKPFDKAQELETLRKEALALKSEMLRDSEAERARMTEADRPLIQPDTVVNIGQGSINPATGEWSGEGSFHAVSEGSVTFKGEPVEGFATEAEARAWVEAQRELNAPKLEQLRENYVAQPVPQYRTRKGEDIAKLYQIANAAMTDLEQKVSELKPVMLANGIPADFREHGKVSLIGLEVNNVEDLAVAAQVFRDPRFETLRYFFMRGNKVVGQTGVTSRLPGSSAVFIGQGRTGFNEDTDGAIWLKEQMAAVGADGYYMQHNHPSGNPSPSSADMRVTQELAHAVPGFLGHVIINGGKYGVIEAYANPDPFSSNNYFGMSLSSDVIYKSFDQTYRAGENPVLPHPALRMEFDSPETLAAVSKQIQVDPGYAVMVGLKGGGVSGIMEVHPSSFSNLLRTAALVRRFARQTGTQDVFLVLPKGYEESLRTDPFYTTAIRSDLFRDVIDADGWSLSQDGFVFPDTTMNLGKRGLVGLRADQQRPAYLRQYRQIPQPSGGKGSYTGPVTNMQQLMASLPVEVRERIQEAKKGLGDTRPLRERLAEKLEHIVHGFTRHWIDLPVTAEFAQANEALRQMEAAPEWSKETTIRILDKITKDMTPGDYELFSMKVLFDDLAYEDSIGHALPFGFTSASLAAARTNVDGLVAGNKLVRDRLAVRQKEIDQITSSLVSRGILSVESVKNPAYFRHQVLTYARVRQYAQGASKIKKPRPGYAKHRAGSLEDINANYLEAEFEFMQRALVDMRMIDTIERISAHYDMTLELKAQAKAAGIADWETLIPSGFTAWQPEPGNVWYRGKTVTDTVLDRWLDSMVDIAAQNEILPQDIILEAAELMNGIRDGMVMGGRKRTLILPEELASTMSKMRDPEKGLFDAVLAAPMAQWKRWVLINPHRVLKYNLNNLTGDLDAVIAANPHILKRMNEAVGELWNILHGADPSERYREAVLRGVFDSGLTVQEIPDINFLGKFRHLNTKAEKGAIDFTGSLAQKLWSASQDYTRFRENWLRYAAYLDYADRLKAGESLDVLGWGASNPDMVAELLKGDYRDAAGLLAREVVGDYGNVSAFGMQLRAKVIPFYSWLEVNTKRYIRLFGNAYRQTRQTGGTKGAVAGTRAAASLFGRIFLLYGIVQLWNNLFYGDDEDDLDVTERVRLHLNLGKDDDGVIRLLRTQGALSDFLAWFGFEDAVAAMTEIGKGRADLSDLLGSIAKAPINKVIGGVTPVIKTPVELASGMSFWPDVFNPRSMHDRPRQVASLFSLDAEYDWLTGKPTRGLGSTLSRSLFYERDAGEIAYNRIKDMAHSWNSRVKGIEGSGNYTTPRSEALRNYKLAMRYGDQAAAKQFRQDLAKMGVSWKDLNASIERAAPLGAIAKADRVRFIGTLSAEERRVLGEATKWYQKVYLSK